MLTPPRFPSWAVVQEAIHRQGYQAPVGSIGEQLPHPFWVSLPRRALALKFTNGRASFRYPKDTPVRERFSVTPHPPDRAGEIWNEFAAFFTKVTTGIHGRYEAWLTERPFGCWKRVTTERTARWTVSVPLCYDHDLAQAIGRGMCSTDMGLGDYAMVWFEHHRDEENWTYGPMVELDAIKAWLTEHGTALYSRLRNGPGARMKSGPTGIVSP